MKIIILILLLLSFDISASGKKTKINIHTFGVDGENSLILNTETNQYLESTYINTGLTLSTDTGWDLSISSQNIPILNGGTQSFQADTYLNISKKIKVNGYLDLTVGTQNGYQLYDTVHIGKVHQFHYSDLELKLTDNITLRGGEFYVNKELSTKSEYVGGIAGITLSYKDFEIIADYFSGHNNVSGASVDFGYYVKKWLQPYIGIGIPEQNSGNEFYGEFGINISTSSLK